MVTNILPIRWKPHQTVEKVTNTEMADEDKYWLPHEAELPADEPPGQPRLAGDHVEEG